MNTDGALYESFSRGKKDTFFIRDSPESVFLFDNRYNPQPQSIHELRRTVPLTAPAWGRPLEFELEIAGDLSTDHTLLIDLPSWVPPAIQRYPAFTDPAATQPAPTYIQHPAYFLFDKIQFFQDSLLLQEVSGDSLYFKSLLDSSINQHQLNQLLTNQHQGSLRLPLPIPQPLPALTGQTFRLKVFIKKLDSVLPIPPPSTLYYKTSKTSDPIPFQTLLPIPLPTLLLESKQHYLAPAEQALYKSQPLTIPFTRFYENIFQISPQEYARGGLITRRLEARHPASRLFFYFRDQQNPTSLVDAWSSLSFLVAGQEREYSWTPSVLRNLSQHAKADRSSPTIDQIGLIDWTLGDLQERRLPYEKTPEGTLNFTTADRPTLLFQLKPTTQPLQKELRVVIESWLLLIVENGRARLLSAN